MQAYLQDLHSQQGLQIKADAAEAGQQYEEDEAAPGQHTPSIEQLQQQCLAQQQQLEEAEEEREHYKALVKNETQKGESSARRLSGEV